MRVLYVATQGEKSTTLSVDMEIDKLERLFSESPASFSSLRSITAESLPGELSRREYDVLHVTAHGEGHALQVLSERGATVLARPEQIAAFLVPRRLPRLVYLNACDSEPVAQEVAKRVQFAIGNTAPVASDYSIHAALAFYGRVLLGGSIAEAADVARNAVELFTSGRASLTLHSAAGQDPRAAVLMPEPELLAAMPKGLPKNKRVVEIFFGVRGAPESTVQVVFFSDDEALIDFDDEEPLGAQICAVARGRPSRNSSIWCDRTESWDVEGDFKVFAIGVTAEGRRWTASAHLCEALRRWYAGLDERDSAFLPVNEFEAALRVLERWGEPEVRPASRRPRHRKR